MLTAIPVTLALTLFVFYLYGYTLNRITLFALIFSIGILVDDAIVVVENIVRHARAVAGGRLSMEAIAIRAVDEVGNPTILATLTVVAAILPMAFVGGLMGPYMRPIPVGATAAMLFSLVVAFIVTPWAAVRLLKDAGGASRRGATTGMTAAYRRVMALAHRATPAARWAFLGGVAVLLLAAIVLVPLGLVTVKMLPFDNKSELQVMVRMPDDTPLEATARVADALADEALRRPGGDERRRATRARRRRTPSTAWCGTTSCGASANLADLQVMLTSQGRARRAEPRHRQAAARAAAAGGRALGASIQVVEVPPGPPVLQTLVAEVYGPDADAPAWRSRSDVRGDVREHRRRGGRGLVRRDAAAEAAARRGRREGGGRRRVARRRSRRSCGWPAPARRPGCCTTPRAREAVPVVLRLPRDRARVGRTRCSASGCGGRRRCRSAS